MGNTNLFTIDPEGSKPILEVEDAINIISGAYVLPFFDTLYTMVNEDTNTMESIFNLMNSMYQTGQIMQLKEWLGILYKLIDLSIPEELFLFLENDKTRNYCLFSFLLDFDDILQDYKLI